MPWFSAMQSTHELVDGGVQPACLDGLEHGNGLQPTGSTQAVTNHGLRKRKRKRDRGTGGQRREGGGAKAKGG